MLEKREKLKSLEQLFRLNGKPLELSPHQELIFESIIGQTNPRVQVLAPTQYGKSLTVALATLPAVVGTEERFVILAPTEKKARIIMDYIIEHCFDSNLFLNALDLEQGVTFDRLRRERTRTHLTFKKGGGVMILTLDAKNSKRNIEAAMGFGGNRIILDESSLIPDPLYATVKRMLGGYPYRETFLLEIGNPFYRNHFLRTWQNDNYQKIFIDYHIGLEEGRYSQEFIDEMRQEAFFDIFYECKFPDEDIIDTRGYRVLINNDLFEKSIIDIPETEGELKLGADIGGGGDSNVYILRNQKNAWVEGANRSDDTMTNVVEIENILKKYPNLKPENIFVDDIGIGRGVTDRLKEKKIKINGISVGMPPKDKTRYKNLKAEASWAMKLWLENGGKLQRKGDLRQITWLKYKVDTDKVLSIEPKDELKMRVGKSPDYADALLLTFMPHKPRPDILFV
jgi:hypothetical protein